jgi:hypothetical protein
MKKTIYFPNEKIELSSDPQDWTATILHDQAFKFFLKERTPEERCIILARGYGYNLADIGFIQGFDERTVRRKLMKLKIEYKKFFNLVNQ